MKSPASWRFDFLDAGKVVLVYAGDLQYTMTWGSYGGLRVGKRDYSSLDDLDVVRRMKAGKR